MKTTKSLCTDLSYHYTNSLVLHEWLQYYISITEGLECLYLLLYLFIELTLLFSPVLDKTLYVLSLVSLVSLLVQPMAEQDQRLALLRCKPSGSSLALVEDNPHTNISVLFSKLSPCYC